MATFSDFLSSFDSASKGLQFEHFVKWFLQNDPEWSTQVEQIWLWDDYPERWGRDCGVDLVFKHKNGEIWAVQAKCYSPEYSITKADVDKFLSESNRNGIDKRLLIASTDQIGKNAKQVCEAQEKAVTHFLFSDFDKAAIEYPDHVSELNTAKRKPRPTPRPHQLEAIDAVEAGFKENDRGQLIMACGTGKTFTTLWVKECLSAQSTLVLLPSLSLLSQTLREWTSASNESFEVLCVCSDQTVGKQSSTDEIIHSVKDMSFPVTSDVGDISTFLKGDGNKVVFSTYQSSPMIAKAQLNENTPSFDLVVADEAHRCTGATGNAFTTILDQSLIRANKRLFTTATPRTYSANLKKKSSEMGVDITGMDDESVFGTVLYALPFGEAIKRGLLTDYQVVLVGVDNPMIADWIQRRQLIQTDENNTVDAKSLASQIGLIKAIKDYDLTKMITFHSRVKRAENFASELKSSIALIQDEHRPDGDIWTDYVSGAMPAHKRRLKLDQLKSLKKGERGLLSNAKCLAEGVDVPSLDGVAFIDPRSSQVDIVQAVGRAIRLSDEKTVGTIVLPVFIEDGDDAELSMQSSNFKSVWEVINALKSHDEVLAFELDKYRTDMGRGQISSNSGSGFSKIVFDFPTTIDQSFSESLTTLLVDKTTSSWNFWYGLLQEFMDNEGHAHTPSNYKTVHGFKLGSWVSDQRTKKDLLSHERRSMLEALDGWVWNVAEFFWEQGFTSLEQYTQQQGHARPHFKYKTAHGHNLGVWVVTQRLNKPKLSTIQITRLESLEGWVWDSLEFKWEQGFDYLEQYTQQQGHARPHFKYKTAHGHNLGSWVVRQRSNKPKLSTIQITRLESLEGWVWDSLEFKWEQGFDYLEQYIQQQGHALVPATFKMTNDFNLGDWVSSQRSNKNELTPERIYRLERLDKWVWDVSESIWEQMFSYLKEFVQQSGHARVSGTHKTDDGFNLGLWVLRQRTNQQQLNPDQISKLESLSGWVWDVAEYQWQQGFNHLKQYVQQFGNAKVPASYKTNCGFNLGIWVGGQRIKKTNLSPEKIVKLETLNGWTWNTLGSAWNLGFTHLQQYVQRHGEARVPLRYKTREGFSLGAWVSSQRRKHLKLTSEQIENIESLNGWVWDGLVFKWEQGFAYLEEFCHQNGHAGVNSEYKTEDGYSLGRWVSRQRKVKEQLSEVQLIQLQSLQGWTWDAFDHKWEKALSYLYEYIKKYNNSKVPHRYKAPDGFSLGQWVSVQRKKENNLTPERISKLQSLNDWDWK